MSEQKQKAYISTSAKLMVAFPPEKFGREETDEMLEDERGRPIVVDGKPVYRKRQWAPVRFGADGDRPGRHTETRPEYIEMLDKHPANGILFYEEPDTAGNVQRVMAGEVVMDIPEVVTEDDRVLIGRIARYYDKSPPTVRSTLMGVRRDFQEILDRFNVQGLALPPAEKGVKLLRGRIIELLMALEDVGLWSSGGQSSQEPAHPEEEPPHDRRGGATAYEAVG